MSTGRPATSLAEYNEMRARRGGADGPDHAAWMEVARLLSIAKALVTKYRGMGGRWADLLTVAEELEKELLTPIRRKKNYVIHASHDWRPPSEEHLKVFPAEDRLQCQKCMIVEHEPGAADECPL